MYIEKVLNKFFYILKIIMMLASFVLSLYIIVYMYKRLEKDIMETVSIFIPFVLMFLLFSINMILNQKSVKENIFYNITCCVVFGFLLFAGYRAIYDNYMVANMRLGFKINFNYYSDIIAPMQAMLYSLCISNVVLMFLKDDKRDNIGIKTSIIKE
ncbi:MAG: hypothetical protein RR359_04265 [Bacilli bacterium]